MSFNNDGDISGNDAHLYVAPISISISISISNSISISISVSISISITISEVLGGRFRYSNRFTHIVTSITQKREVVPRKQPKL